MGVELVPFLMAKEILHEKQPVFRRCDVGSAKRRPGLCRCWAGPGKRSGGRRQSGGSRQHSIEDGALGAIWPEQSPWVWKNTYIFIQDCDKKPGEKEPSASSRITRVPKEPRT